MITAAIIFTLWLALDIAFVAFRLWNATDEHHAADHYPQHRNWDIAG